MTPPAPRDLVVTEQTRPDPHARLRDIEARLSVITETQNRLACEKRALIDERSALLYRHGRKEAKA